MAAAGFEGPNGVKLPLTTAPANSDGRPAVYGIRPEHFTIADDGAEAEIVVVEPTGSETQVIAKLGGEQVIAVFRERHQFNPGDKVRLKPNPTLVHLFDETHRQATELLSNQNEPIKGGWTMQDFTRRTLLTGRHRASGGRRAYRAGLARIRQGLGSNRALESREGRQAHGHALEALRAGGG